MIKITKRNIFFFLLSVVLIITVIYTINQTIFFDNYRPLEDFTKIDDYPLYTARYVEDYRFDEYLKTGRRPTLGQIGCTCFTIEGELFGRNFDFPANPALLLWTSPPDGYRSVSMIDLGYFDYSMNKLPKSEPGGLAEAPYMPFDGMNERGLVVGMAAISTADPPYESDKVSIGEIAVIRLLLDYAGNVEEAIELFDMYNVIMTDPPIHYLIADPSGDSAIIEFIDGQMMVYRGNEYPVITNFIVTGKNLPDDSPCDRYDSAIEDLEMDGSDISVQEAIGILQRTSQPNTIWSMVYDNQNLKIYVSMGRNFSQIYSFNLMRENQ